MLLDIEMVMEEVIYVVKAVGVFLFRRFILGWYGVQKDLRRIERRIKRLEIALGVLQEEHDEMTQSHDDPIV